MIHRKIANDMRLYKLVDLVRKRNCNSEGNLSIQIFVLVIWVVFHTIRNLKEYEKEVIQFK